MKLKIIVFGILFSILGIILCSQNVYEYTSNNHVLKQNVFSDYDYVYEYTCNQMSDEMKSEIDEMKPIVVYYLGLEMIDACDNPNVNILTTIPDCDLEGWYYDQSLTQKITATKIGDILPNKTVEEITSARENNTCFVGINYVESLYAKCKVQPNCPVTNNEYNIHYIIDGKEVDVQKVQYGANQKLREYKKDSSNCLFSGWFLDSAYTRFFSGTNVNELKTEEIRNDNGCIIGYKDVYLYANSKCQDENPTLKNPDTGDNMIIYSSLGIIFLIGCILVTHKLVKK